MENFSHDIFISFSFKDQAYAESLVNRLLNVYKISCWICTQDIYAGEHYKRTIVNAINDTKLVLLLQSENSMRSTEVPKEISLALNKNKPVIPFVIDNSELTGDLEYDLLTVQRIDARRPTFEERVEELARQVCAALGRPFSKEEGASAGCEETAKLLSTPSVIPKNIFCGRDSLLAEISSTFKSGERVIFLHGIGGIGKTQIAKQYAKQYRGDYDTVVFATYERSIKELIVSDSVFMLSPPLNRYTMEDGSTESDDSYAQRKLPAIKRAATEKTLIIIDNFDVESDELLNEFADGRYHVLITTRCDHSRNFHTIKIDPLSSIDDLKELFFRNYNGYDVEEDDPALIELIELVNRHTYTIELLAQHMENSGQTAEEMLTAIKKEGIISLNEKVLNSDMHTSVAYENLLKMFKIFSLNESERDILTYLSLMPLSGVNARDFRLWADIPSTRDIKSLEMRSWLVRSTDGIALHPIIREVVKTQLAPNEENCEGFLARFTDTIMDKKAWHMKKADKDRYSGIVKSILSHFDRITPKTEALYYHAQSLVSFNFESEYALELGKKIYDYHLNTYGENSFKTATAANKIGWMYFHSLQSVEYLKNSAKWLDRSEKIFGSLELTTSDEIAKYTHTNANLTEVYLKLYSMTHDEEFYEKALFHAQKNLSKAEVSFTPGEFHYLKIGGAHFRYAMLYLEKNDYEKALEHANKAIDIIVGQIGENDIDSATAFWLKAQALFGLKHYEQARSLARKSVDIYTDFLGSYHADIYHLYILLGNCHTALSEQTEAVEAYESALSIAERIYEPGSASIKSAAELLAKARN